MKLKIGTKIVAGFSVVLILLAIMSAVSIISTRSIGKDVKAIDIVNERLSLQKNIEIHFYSAVSGIRGYIAYGSDKFKDAYNTEMSQVLEMEKRLMEITTEDKKAEVQRLMEVTGSYHKGITDELMPAIQKQYQATNTAASTAAREEVVRIAGTLTPITGQLTETLRGLVTSDEKVFKGGIESTSTNVANVISTSVVLSIVAFILGLALSLFIARSIKNPIMQMVKGANKFADGDFTGEIKVRSSDEVGDLANSLNTMAARLRSLIADVITNAQTLAAHSQELAGSAQEVSATIEEVASTTNEVAAMAERSMENANQTAAESNKAVAVAEKGGKTVGQTVEKINFISKSTSRVQESVQNLGDLSAKIGNITKIITGIADQTNLLALNAAIEAARAGDQGRGFAVVAEEVRKLAEQSASAAGEIGQLINQIKAGVDTAIKAMEQGSSDVNEGVNLASEAGAALEAIIMAINNNITLVNEIALGAKQTSEGTQQLSASNEQVTSTIQQVAGATQELAQIANTLQSSVAQFKV